MKKLSYLLGILLIGGMIFSACSKDDDDDDEPTVKTPTMNFKGGTHQGSGTDYVAGNVTLETGELFWVGITANENSSSGSNLTNLKITRKYMDVITIVALDSTFNEPSFSLDIGFLAYPQAGTEVWTFVMTDKAGEKAQLSFTITTEAAAPTIATYSETVLGSWESPTNSSFASINGTTYNIADAKANSEKIDWMYFDGTSYGHTLAAPNDPLVEQVFTGANGPATWTTRNATKFDETGLTADQFDDIAHASEIAVIAQNANLTRLSETELGGMAVGDVFAFKTAAEKMGVIKITNTEQGSSNSLSKISFIVKVQL
ncbi:MAG: hypothetical protein JXA03_10395 [Bacteroidales bacterium]|nr:hypothetical protein [Bacteroidales bacterium]